MKIGLGEKTSRISRIARKLVAAVAGILTLAAVAEEQRNQILTAVSSTTLSGYVSTSAQWNSGSSTGGQQIASVSFLSFTNSQAQLLLSVPVGSTNTLEVSTNLATWIPVLTCVLTNDGTSSVSTNSAVMLTHSNLVNFPLLYYRFVDSSARLFPSSVDPAMQTIRIEINRAFPTNQLPPLPPTDISVP